MWRMINKPERRNFYVRNGVAYTEDRIPIRRVSWSCVYPIPLISVTRHFSDFGSLSEVTQDHRTDLGTILFMTVFGAARALYNQSHFVNGKRVNLMASPTRYQPQFGGGTISGYDLAITDDVLRTVVRKYLTLESRINFAATCPRFEEIYLLESKNCTKVLYLAELGELTDWGITELMRLSGPHIQVILGGPLPMRWPHMKRLVTMLGPCCPALKSVHLTEVLLTNFHLNHLFERSQGIRCITELTLRRCGLMDHDLLSLNEMSSIMYLDVGWNTGLVGLTLYALPHSIATLVLSRCPNLKPSNLQRLGNRPQLRNLRCSIILYRTINVEWMEDNEPNTNEEVYKPLVVKCPKLYILEVTVCPYQDEDEIANFPELTRLTLVPLPIEPEPYSVKDSLMSALAEKNILEHLDIGYANSSFVGIDSLRAITRLTHLQSLTLPNQDLSDFDLRDLANLSDLRYLNVSGSTYLTNTTVVNLVKKLRRLRVLSVRRCPKISCEVFPALLMELRSRRHDLSDEHLAKSLELDVTFTKVVSIEIPEAQDLLKVII
ncbi:uncharacterized protein [Drosophila bipectinata]|uniref:uncharacterized protein n=1 Tax=Drosophila bipectinata TaxID=42026 RepID=UPI001C88E35E|nr:uncharacterized protein LOC108132283 [Drosophila bipectinata]